MTLRRPSLVLILAAALALPAAACAETAPAPQTSEAAAPESVLDQAHTVSPFDWAAPIGALWSRGDRLQAAFWYYVWQIRSGPWAEADPQARPLRGALTETLGRPVNEWLAGDPAAWRDIAARAIAYEKTLPLFEGRPDGIDAAAWRALNERRRAEYEAGFNATFDNMDIEAVARQRREAGLAVGPLEGEGRPIPWQ